MTRFNPAIVNTHDWDSKFDILEPTTETHEDPLLLSCVLYRLTNQDPDVENGTIGHNFMSNFIKEQITEEDRVFAGIVRRHYNDKIVLTTLRGDRFTPFRQDLARFLSGEFKTTGQNHQFPTKFFGMLYKLPYFYHYDKELDSVFDGQYYPLRGDVLNYETEQQELNFIKKVRSYRKGHTPHEYWFRDHRDDRIMLSVDARCPTTNLFDHYLSTNKTVAVKGLFRAARKDTLEYYRAQTWSLKV